ncbi:MAG: hypothetical protein M5U12_06585 [Verrucomicrobia bacterium]|nr:hypothetical protein [Verrucomicrobiota bacterium]
MPVENTISEVSPVSEVSQAPVTPAPATPERPRYKPEVLAALREFRHSRPWRGTVQERKEKFQILHAALCRIYERQVELHFDVDEPETPVGNGWAAGDRTQIGLVGKLSVVTFLHEWAHVLFRAERGAGLRVVGEPLPADLPALGRADGAAGQLHPATGERDAGARGGPGDGTSGKQ